MLDLRWLAKGWNEGSFEGLDNEDGVVVVDCAKFRKGDLGEAKRGLCNEDGGRCRKVSGSKERLKKTK